MRVLVALAVVQFAHELRRRVADDQRHRLGQLRKRVLPRAAVSFVQGVGLGREGEVDHRLGQVHRTFRHADEVAGLIGGHGDLQRPRVGKPHVLAGKARHAAGDVERVLAGLQHARQPVHRRVRVGIAHGLVQRGDEVVVFLALLVVEQGFFGGALFQRLFGHGDAVFVHLAVEHHHFQRRKGAARVAVGKGGDGREHLRLNVDPRAAKAACVRQRPLKQ